MDAAIHGRIRLSVDARVAGVITGRGWRVTTDEAMDYAACIIGAPAGRQESVIVTLAAEVRRLNSPVLKSDWQQMEADLAALREQHAAAVALIERCREWPEYAADRYVQPLGVTNYRVANVLVADIDAWLSKARKRVTT